MLVRRYQKKFELPDSYGGLIGIGVVISRNLLGRSTSLILGLALRTHPDLIFQRKRKKLELGACRWDRHWHLKRVSRGIPSSLPGGAAIVGSAEPLERMKRNLQPALRCSHLHAPWPRERLRADHTGNGGYTGHSNGDQRLLRPWSGLRAAWGVAGLRIRTLTKEK